MNSGNKWITYVRLVLPGTASRHATLDSREWAKSIVKIEYKGSEVRWNTIWRETVASSVCHKILSDRCDCTYGLPLFHAESCFISPHFLCILSVGKIVALFNETFFIKNRTLPHKQSTSKLSTQHSVQKKKSKICHHCVRSHAITFVRRPLFGRQPFFGLLFPQRTTFVPVSDAHSRHGHRQTIAKIFLVRKWSEKDILKR